MSQEMMPMWLAYYPVSDVTIKLMFYAMDVKGIIDSNAEEGM